MVQNSQHAGAASEPEFDEAAYREQQFALLPEEQRKLMRDLETKAAAAADHAEKKNLLNQLIAASEKNKLEYMACMYSLQIAELDNTPEAWTKTGDNFTETYSADTTNSPERHFMVHKAVESYQKALDFDTANVESKIRLGSAYMDEGAQVMQGVQILLSIVRSDPDNLKANFILGRYGIISGQYEKAVQRLTKVIQLDPRNFEAHLLLGEAYNALGQKDKAIEYYEKCKALADDPNFSAEIDAYIKKIKNS
jgi:tetratricopeptide (TPR) repeat protein